MKKILLIAILLLVTAQSYALPVFPGAEGFGTDTVAGSGRHLSSPQTTVYKVTTLNSDGPGSIAECMQASGPRVCVFEVAGTIRFRGYRAIINPYITIAGQTAPPPGIQIAGGGLWISGARDVLIQHLRVRPGDDPDSTKGNVRRAMSMSSRDGNAPHHVVIDHCSLQWGIDANANVWAYQAHSITFSNNIIAECLNYSLHPEGWHSMTLNIDHSQGGGHRNISIIKNYFAHGGGRNPKIGGNTHVQLVNNVIYNMRSYPIVLTDSRSHGPHHTTIVGNVHINGVNSQWGKDYTAVIQATVSDGSRIYADDNVCNNYPDCLRLDRPAAITLLDSPEIWSPMTVLPTTNNEARDYVLANAGARPVERDETEIRVTQEAIDITGQVIDCVGPDPIYFPTGTAEGGSSNTIILEDKSDEGQDPAIFSRTWVGQEIEITSGTGSGQVRSVTAHSGNTRIATVDPAWNTTPDTTSVYRRNMDCSKNVGGWPVYAENYRELTIPDNPNADDDGDGYTNLEEWLHNFSAIVEGRAPEPSEPPPQPPPPNPADIDDDGDIDLDDLIHVVNDFGKRSGFTYQKADTDNNNMIDIFDVVFVASRFT